MKVQLMEFNEAKIPSRLAQMRPLIHDGEKSSFPFEFEMLLQRNRIYRIFANVEKQKQF